MVTCRLTLADRERLEKICEDRGITINEGLRLGVSHLFRGHPGKTAVSEGKPAEKPRVEEKPRHTEITDNAEEYEKAIASVRTKSGKYRCPQCGRYLKTEDGFYQHVERCMGS